MPTTSEKVFDMSAVESLWATTERWQKEMEDGRIRAEEEARRPWMERKLKRSLGDAKDRWARWEAVVAKIEKRVWLEYQCFMVGLC